MGWLQIAEIGVDAAMGIGNMVQNAQSRELQKQQLEETKRQADLNQKNIKDSQNRQDAAEKNAMNTSSDFMTEKDKEQEDSNMNTGILSQPLGSTPFTRN